MRTRLTALGTVLLSIFVALPASAGSGAIEINQASVVAAGGFPFTISTPGSYVLTSDLVVSDVNTTAIHIQAATGVTLDLGGFSVRGPVTCTGPLVNEACSQTGNGIGIQIGDGAAAVIRNGYVRGMGGRGIGAFGDRGSVIEHMVVEGNGSHGVDLSFGRLVDSMVRFNAGNGVHFCNCGNGGSNQIDHNVIEGNRLAGINGGRGTIKDNYVYRNGAEGVVVGAGGSNGVHIDGNTIEQNGGNALNVGVGVYRNNALRSNLSTSGHQVQGGVMDGGGNYCSPAC